MRSGLKLGFSRPSQMLGPTSKLYTPPSAPLASKLCRQPPGRSCDSSTLTEQPYLASMAPHERPPTPEPITTTSYTSSYAPESARSGRGAGVQRAQK